MKKIILVLIFITSILGCSNRNVIRNTEQGSYASTTKHYDSFTNKSTVSAGDITVYKSGFTFVNGQLSFVDGKYIIVAKYTSSNRFGAGQLFINSVYLDGGHKLDFKVINMASNDRDFSSELFAIALPDKYINLVKSNGLRIKVNGSSSSIIITMSKEYISGFLRKKNELY